MIYDSIELLGSTQVTNPTVDSGTSFPADASSGEMFFRTDDKQMYLYTGTEWIQVTGTAQGSLPKITGVTITDSSFNVLDDTAVDLTGGYIKISGTGFDSGATVRIDQTLATSVTFISETELRAQVPAKTAGTYNLYVVNSDASVAIRVNGLTYSAFPAWSTSSNLSGTVNEAISIQLSAPDATSYTLAAGSTLPAGLTLTSGGLLSGTITGIQQVTVYTFSVLATDAQNQDTSRGFNLTVSVFIGEEYFKNTVLLLKTASENARQNNSFTDSSASALSVTRLGNTAPSSFSPYGLTGWSNFFDGTGDYLSIATNAALDFGTGDFTVEAWVYPTSLATDWYISSASGSGGFFVGFSSSSTIGYGWGRTATAWDYRVAGTATVNTWQHVAVTRSGSSMRLFINGVQAGTTQTLSTAYNMSTGSTTIGSQGAALYFSGYMSNVRIIKGTAVYTSNFSPDVAPLSAIAGTSLLTCQSNRFIDNSSNNLAITRNGDAKISTFSPFKFNNNEYSVANYGVSAYFDGTGDYLSVPTDSALAFGTGDFTIEYWQYSTSAPALGGAVYEGRGTANTTAAIYIANNAQVYVGSSNVLAVVTTVTQNTWVHVAVSRQGTTLRRFINGTLNGSATNSTNLVAPTTELRIGTNDGANGTFVGFISGLRVVKGTAVYTTNFTPPTSPVTAIANTTLLLTSSPGIYDATGRNFVETVGNAQTATAVKNNAFASISFDGTGDSLKIGHNDDITLGSSDFTLECWAYFNNVSSTMVLINKGWQSGAGTNFASYLIYMTNTGSLRFNSSANGTSWGIASDRVIGQMTANTWTHIAVTRSGNTFRAFINGTIVPTFTFTNSSAMFTSAVQQLYIGAIAAGTSSMNGYLEDIRITKGIARYTDSFTPQATAFEVRSN